MDTPDAVPATEVTTENVPATPAPVIVFPVITRRFWDVFYDDERHEVWFGVKVRTTIKGQTRENGPIEDVAVNIDATTILVALDAAKQEVMSALMKDSQALNEERARKAALKSTGILDRLTAGLRGAMPKSILTH